VKGSRILIEFASGFVVSLVVALGAFQLLLLVVTTIAFNWEPTVFIGLIMLPDILVGLVSLRRRVKVFGLTVIIAGSIASLWIATQYIFGLFGTFGTL
jgi:hypothetical protein